MPEHLAAALELSVKLHTPAFRVSARPPRCLCSLPLDKPAAVTLLDPCTDGGQIRQSPVFFMMEAAGRAAPLGRSLAGVLSCGGEEEGESVAVRNGAGVPMLTLVSMLPEHSVSKLAISQPGDKVI